MYQEMKVSKQLSMAKVIFGKLGRWRGGSENAPFQFSEFLQDFSSAPFWGKMFFLGNSEKKVILLSKYVPALQTLAKLKKENIFSKIFNYKCNWQICNHYLLLQML